MKHQHEMHFQNVQRVQGPWYMEVQQLYCLSKTSHIATVNIQSFSVATFLFLMIYPEENGKESLHCEFHYNKMNMLNRKMSYLCTLNSCSSLTTWLLLKVTRGFLRLIFGGAGPVRFRW